MKKAVQMLVTACLFLAPYDMDAREEVRPLLPVEVDSVEINDFFWYKLRDSVRQYFPDVQKAVYEPEKQRENLPSLLKQWNELLPHVSLTGSLKGENDNAGRLRSALQVMHLAGNLNLLTGEGKYMDVVERVLYNEVAGAMHDRERAENTADAASEVLAMPQWTYATQGTHLYVNFFLRSDVHVKTDSLDVRLRLVGSMPWYNKFMIVVEMDGPEQNFTLHLRLPSWVTERNMLPGMKIWSTRSIYSLSVNGESQFKHVENGYLVVNRHWKNKDFVHFTIKDNILRINDPDRPGRIALQRGPLVYAFDNMAGRDSIWLKPLSPINNRFDKENACIRLYTHAFDRQGVETDTITAIPYAWNRAELKDRVFVNQLMP